jgi:serine/threonine-protein kinase
MTDAIPRLNAALEGRYRIERELGEGGMATVYLADDLKHERKVALKVLKPELAAVVGAERFLAEIKTTANLSHPHILPLHDSGEADGFLYYVMPYIDGETLRDRLERDKQLPVDEAIRVAKDVAEALHAAHLQGVIHRDIKPANILMSGGRPLVADFGIALAVTAAGGNRMTETGLSLGTPFYMSPEQASADRELGPQSDVYSVGCMLYEMLVGEPPHTGKTAQSVLAKILTERPRSITELRATVPGHVAAAVARSLERLPADRFETAEEFVRALGDVAFTHHVASMSTTQAMGAAPASPTPHRSRVARILPWGVAAAALALAAWTMIPEPASSPDPTYRMALSDFVVENTNGGGWRLAISRDGSKIVAGGADDLLYVRRSDDPVFRPIPGSEGGRNPSISPDGEWVVFSKGAVSNLAAGLVKTELSGGPILPVVSQGGEPHWYTQDEILFSVGPDAYRVSSAGGEPTLVTDQVVMGRPHMLPGGRAVVHESVGGGLGLFVLDSGEERPLVGWGSQGAYVPTGHILYGDRDLQSVMALPFDLDALEATGPAVPVLSSVSVFGGGAVQLAVSDNGTLVHGVSPGVRKGDGELTLIDLDGTRTTLPLAAGVFNSPRFSPDGGSLAYQTPREVRIFDIVTGANPSLTDALGPEVRTPNWPPDGESLLVRTPEGGVFRVPIGDAASTELVADLPGATVWDISPDGRVAVGEKTSLRGGRDLFALDLESDSPAPAMYLEAEWNERHPAISPDGRWLAYTSNEEGIDRVYVRSFPEPGAAVEISGADARLPVWDPSGAALYYMSGPDLVRREVRLGDSPALGSEDVLFTVADTEVSSLYRQYDIHPDGSRFVFVTSGAGAGGPELELQGIGPVLLVVNWFEELRQRMAAGG